MIRLAIALLLLSYSCSSVFAQDYIPTLRPCSRWTVGIGLGHGSFREVNVELSEDAITLDNKSYYKLEVENMAQDCIEPTGYYVREDTIEKQVFFMSDAMFGGEEVMIADYSLAIGDSMVFPEWGVPLKLDTIFYHNIFGATQRA